MTSSSGKKGAGLSCREERQDDRASDVMDEDAFERFCSSCTPANNSTKYVMCVISAHSSHNTE